MAFLDTMSDKDKKEKKDKKFDFLGTWKNQEDPKKKKKKLEIKFGITNPDKGIGEIAKDIFKAAKPAFSTTDRIAKVKKNTSDIIKSTEELFFGKKDKDRG